MNLKKIGQLIGTALRNLAEGVYEEGSKWRETFKSLLRGDKGTTKNKPRTNIKHRTNSQKH
jgi:hypothetical protein